MLVSTVRVAYLADFSPRKLGTGENGLVALAREVSRRGHTMTVFCRSPVHPDVEESLRVHGVTCHDLESLLKTPFRSVRRLSRDFDVIQLNLIAPRSKLALLAYLAWPVRVLFVDHVSGPPAGASETRQSTLSRLMDRGTMQRVWQAAGVSQYVTNRLRRRFALPERRTITLYGGVDTGRFRPPDRRASHSPFLRITVVAALIPEKGIDVLLTALHRGGLGPWRLRIVGDGPDQERLRDLARQLGLEQSIDFLGLRDDVDEILRETDVFVHPAIWQEALGFTILEGMASGCPVVATSTGGIPELISSGKDGVLVDAGNEAALHAALQRLAADPALRQELGRAGRKRVVDSFSLARHVARKVDWFELAATSRS